MDKRDYTLEAVIEAIFGPTLGELMHNEQHKHEEYE